MASISSNITSILKKKKKLDTKQNEILSSMSSKLTVTAVLLT
jgi:hypothetical protein